ncbi:MAG TPA: UvrD-helicase domain-containing protein [Methylotenera sp.]|nr:UvrD-helicase domain-containing protein [Methylotenera sp.]HPV43886.1 UvrD-helicase domain-containing protein [Methylotenera sp.]
MNTLNLMEDEKNRKRALELASFIVEAPAGAGKTELLTQRFLKLLQTVSAPEEIIAITFTNKAAAEMRLRILDSLINAAKHTPPPEPHKKITYELSLQALQHAQTHDWKLVENPSRLRIFTIDSLCAHLARQMPLMSRFGSQPKVADDAGILYAQAVEQALGLLEDAEHGEVVKTALRYVDNDAGQLKKLLVKMLEKRDQWLHHAQYEIDAKTLQDTLRGLIAQELEIVSQVINHRLQYELMPLARFAASQLPCEEPIASLKDWETPLATHAEALPMWLAVCELLLTNNDGIRARIDKNIGFLPEHTNEKTQFKAFLQSLESIAGFADTLAKTRKLPFISSKQNGWRMIAALSKLLNLAVAQLWFVFQRAGEVDFVEIAQRATQALSNDAGEPTELALKLDYQIRHLLVDEFQDTSPSQIALLEQLMQGWQQDDGRTLFCVGDPMQSIYRFRKANVSLFIHAANNGIGDIRLQRLRLYRNNRACPPVVDWINQTFASVFPEVDDESQGAIRYRESIANPEHQAPDSGIEVHAVIKHESTPDAKQLEAETVIEIIRRERMKHPDKKIAVLVSAKRHLAPLVTQLRRAHQEIAFQAVEIEALAGRQIVQDLLALTHALHHRADRVYWLATLRAPWCGLTLHDLHMLAGHDHHSTVWSLMQNDEMVNRLSADGQIRLKHVRGIFAEAFSSQGRMPVCRWIRGVWLMLNGTVCLWEQNDVMDVQAFFKCLDDLDKRNQFSLERMDAEIEKLFAAPDSEGELLQMMTIHKSKGLEFDTVILPGLGTQTGGNNSEKPLVLWEEIPVGQHAELLAAPYIPKGARDKDKVSPYDFLATREKVRDANEDARVLYVAATRAERKLHLVGIAGKNAKGEIKPASGTPLELLWPAVGRHFEDANSAEQLNNIADDIADFTPHLVRLQHLHIPAVLQTEKTVYANTNTAKIKPARPDNLEADSGTLAHRYMEIIARQGLTGWPPARIAQLASPIQHWLRERGHSSQNASLATSQVIRALQRTLASTDGQWVLQAREEAHSEYALTSQDGEQHVIDRTFIENRPDNKKVRWIIDYKLGLDVTEANASAAAQGHKPQLARYAGLFANEGLTMKQAVFFLSLGKLIEI